MDAIEGANEAKLAEADAKISGQPAKLKQAEANYQREMNAAQQQQQNAAFQKEQMEVMKTMQENTNKVMMSFMEIISKKL